MGILLPLRFEYVPFYLAISVVCCVTYWFAGPIGLSFVSVPGWMGLVAYHAMKMQRELERENSAVAKPQPSDQG